MVGTASGYGGSGNYGGGSMIGTANGYSGGSSVYYGTGGRTGMAAAALASGYAAAVASRDSSGGSGITAKASASVYYGGGSGGGAATTALKPTSTPCKDKSDPGPTPSGAPSDDKDKTDYIGSDPIGSDTVGNGHGSHEQKPSKRVVGSIRRLRNRRVVFWDGIF